MKMSKIIFALLVIYGGAAFAADQEVIIQPGTSTLFVQTDNSKITVSCKESRNANFEEIISTLTPEIIVERQGLGRCLISSSVSGCESAIRLNGQVFTDTDGRYCYDSPELAAKRILTLAKYGKCI